MSTINLRRPDRTSLAHQLLQPPCTPMLATPARLPQQLLRVRSAAWMVLVVVPTALSRHQLIPSAP
jgi:hypothetical protein